MKDKRCRVYRTAALNEAFLQVGVLYGERLGRQRLGRSHVHEGAQQVPLAVGIGGHGNAVTVFPLGQKRSYEKPASLRLIHR